MIAEWFDAADPWRSGMEHTAWLIGVITFVVGTVKGIRGWRKARDEAIAARTRHEDMLARIMHEFENNNGGSLLDKVEEGNRQTKAVNDTLATHVETADTWFQSNDDAHAVIHRRIDGLFELIAGSGATTPRKTAARHQNRDNEEGT
jgi:hypothetical protein